jgi:hypothetical protein
MTTQELLDAVETAIPKAILGQSVEVDGVKITRAPLDTLRKMRIELKKQLAAENGKGGPAFNQDAQTGRPQISK